MGSKIVVTLEEATSLLSKPASEMVKKRAPKGHAQQDQEGGPEQDAYDAKQTSIVEAEANWGDKAFENNADEEEVQELLQEELVACESEANEAKRDMIKYMKTDEAVKDSEPPIQFSCQGGCTARGTIEGAEGWYCQTCADDCLIDIPEDLTVTDGHMDIAPDAGITQDNDREAPIRATAPSKARSRKAPTQESAEVMGFKLNEIVFTYSRGGSKKHNTYHADYFIGEIKQFNYK